MKPYLMWSQPEEKYVLESEFSEMCPICDLAMDAWAGQYHDIGSCIRSLADRVKLILTKETK